MATTTPNFGWAVPTSTDLVKDGAVAIETLGDSIDASLLDLKGGTTGQVLAKATNTDMDFSWTTPTDQTPLTTKGDLFTFTTVDARLGVGTNGQYLQADSTAATGLKWATVSSTPTFRGCVLTKSAAQSIANGTNVNITFNTESIDTDAFHDGVNTERITIPAGYAGKYLFTAMGSFAADASGVRAVYLLLNGTIKTVAQAPALSSQFSGYSISYILDLAVSDYVTLQAFQNTGGALNLLGNNTDAGITNFTCTYLGV